MFYLVLIALSYGVFVFLGEGLNPWQRVTSHSKRSRLKFARRMSLLILLLGLVSLLLGDFLGFKPLYQALVFCTLMLLMATRLIVTHYRHTHTR